MRYLPLLCLLFGTLLASEPVYPLWDGAESVADYAKRVNLPPAKTLDLGNGVKMDLVLIPAGKFAMGAQEPARVDENTFRNKIVTGQTLLAAFGTAALVMLVVVSIRAIRKRRWPQFSLSRLTLLIVATGGCVLSALHWWKSAQNLATARLDYQTAKARFAAADPSEKPTHPVILSKPFYMGKFTVTQEQYQQIMEVNPSSFNGKDYPVETVWWDDAEDFCQKLSEKINQTVRLPTEAEWEYACRAGTSSTFYSGDAQADLDRVGWYTKNSADTAHPVGQKAPNFFGLYDMHGNVWQWCQDWYENDYYARSPAHDPQGPEGPLGGSSCHPLRGGSWACPPGNCSSSVRVRYNPTLAGKTLGFRAVVESAKTQ